MKQEHDMQDIIRVIEAEDIGVANQYLREGWRLLGCYVGGRKMQYCVGEPKQKIVFRGFNEDGDEIGETV